MYIFRHFRILLLTLINNNTHVNHYSSLTKLTTSNGQARPIRFENFRIGPSLSNWIESGGRFELESNLEASQVPNNQLTGHVQAICMLTCDSLTVIRNPLQVSN